MTTAAYSLWLLPPAAERAHYAALIQRLARQLGTLPFEPHLTLSAPYRIAETEALTRARQIAQTLDPIAINLTDIDTTDAYFRCLFLHAERTAPLLAAHALACARVGQPVEVDFLPHLSLVYGTLSDIVKKRLRTELAIETPRRFVIDRIGVCQIDGPPTTWRMVETLAVTGPRSSSPEES